MSEGKLHTILVDGPLALRMSRTNAAEEMASGRQILTLPLLAARLAGGFLNSAGQDVLLPAIRNALSAGGFEELDKVADLPGTPRAVLRSLHAWWRCGLVTSDNVDCGRLRDFSIIESRVRRALPMGVMAPPDLAAAAMARLTFAPKILGSLEIDRLIDIEPVWRPLILALSKLLPVRWTATEFSHRGWFTGEKFTLKPCPRKKSTAEACADPRSEVMETLRWARQLLSTGNVTAREIAIAATSTSLWDDHFIVLAKEAGLPLHFTHGIPALASREGQSCAALADILLRGLSQERVRRLLRRLPNTPAKNAIPADWAVKLPRGASLTSIDNWQHVLQTARPHRQDGDRAEQALIPVLTELSKGVSAAESCGHLLLKGHSLDLWQQALRVAPAQAIDLSLQALRVSDGRDPSNSIVWSPACHLAAAPRRYTRLLGLTARSWPRSEEDDPLLPHHLLDRRTLSPISITEEDDLHFNAIASQSEILVLSRSQRSARGTVQAASALWPAEEVVRGRSRLPEHAFSESDRLFARPLDAGKNPQIRSSRVCWRSWQDDKRHTPHDGLIRASHPAIEASLSEVQSITSLQRLLCDPLGYVWEYALGWSNVRLETEPLALDRRAFGELVHALISGTIRDLNTKGGISGKSDTEIMGSLQVQVTRVTEGWPLARAVPPRLLWHHTMEEARERAFRALTHRSEDSVGRSWTEILFGDARASGDHPWSSSDPVTITGTGLKFRGRIDRLDHDETTGAVTITDYKTGLAPPKASFLVFDYGAELQRVFYALAVRALLPNARRVASRLIYVTDDPARAFSLSGQTLDRAIDAAIGFASAGETILRGGIIAPGKPRTFFDQLSLALPADNDAYRRTKQRLFAQANARLLKLWSSA